MDDEVDVDDEEADEQPKNKQPRTTPWPCRLQALDLQNRFSFSGAKSVPRRACAAGPERRTRKRVAGADQGGTGSSAINEGVDQEEMKGRKRPSHPSHLND